MIWTDETGFRLWSSRGPRYVRRRVFERYRPDKVVSTVKYGGGEVLFWGCFSSMGVGPLYRIKGTMTKEVYHTILTTKAMKYTSRLLREYPEISQWTFAADNDPKHGAYYNKKYLEKKAAEGGGRLAIMDWPSQSPDLNPIEHIWNWVKRELGKKGARPSSEDVLCEWVQEVWSRVPNDLITALIEGMPRRVAAVIRARGGVTKY